MITIRQASLADKPAIFEFLRLAYEGRSEFKFPKRWEWAYEHNPHWTGDALPIWIAVENGGRVVGQSAALVEPLVIEGKTYRVGWGVDFHVLPEFRKQGLGTQLQAANNAGNEIFMSLSMTGPTQKIKTGLGMQALPPVLVYMKIINHDPASVRETITKRINLPTLGVEYALAPLLSLRESLKDSGTLNKLDLGISIEEAARFDDETDSLWQRLAPKYSALIRRDAVYLNWKFVEQPHMTHTHIVARRDQIPAGILILRRAQPPERNAGIICELFTDPDDEPTARTLLIHSIEYFKTQKVTYITAASSVPQHQELYKTFGFSETKRVTPMVQAEVEIPREGWLLGKGDHDWDQYPLA